jgi:predicted dehydrogenase
MLRVGIIGAGQIGSKRAREVARSEDCRLVAFVDADEGRARGLAEQYGCRGTSDWQKLLSGNELDAVIVATTHRWLAPITLAALESHKHVLCEKPLAINAEEAKKVVESAARNGAKLKAGYNHRHHPAIWEAHRRAEAGEIGRLLYIRCRYGHGGRAGYEREWRADPAESGGGELLDQGVHGLDLFRWFLGDFSEISAVLANLFWQMPVEDNVFCTLRTPAGQVAMLHASWTQWKNLFSFEIFGDLGYLIVEGLGGSYGPEKLRVGRRPPKFGVPEEAVFDYPGEDLSWAKEWQEFVAAIREDRQPVAAGYDGWQVLRLVEAARESARQRCTLRLQ